MYIKENVQERYTLPDFTVLTLPEEDILLIESVYKGLEESEQKLFIENYRKYTLKKFINNSQKLSKVFLPFFEISKKKGRGRGEFIPLLAIINSKSGGTEDKDILIGKHLLEVKELDKSRKFLTGKSGSIRKSNLSKAVETFCRYLSELSVPVGTDNTVDKVLSYFENEYISSNISETFIQNIITVSKKLDNIGDSSHKSCVGYVKIGDKRFEIQEKSDKLIQGDTITLEKEITDKEIAFKKLKKHEITTNPDVIYDYFSEIVERYLKDIEYFCIYRVGEGTSMEILPSTTLKSRIRTNYISVVQGNIRLELTKN